jgi:hypothetical protein
MGRWKRHGVIVVLFSTDHDPKHVHVFEDRKRSQVQYRNVTVMEGVDAEGEEGWRLYGKRDL